MSIASIGGIPGGGWVAPVAEVLAVVSVEEIMAA